MNFLRSNAAVRLGQNLINSNGTGKLKCMCYRQIHFQNRHALYCGRLLIRNRQKTTFEFNNLTLTYCHTSSAKFESNKETDQNKNLAQNVDSSAPTYHGIEKLFPNPKNTLHNIYANVGEQLKNKDLRPSQEFKLLKHSKSRYTWMCNYRLKWPEEKIFTHVANTKQEASHKAAVQVLHWLKSVKKIDDKGVPFIFDEQEISKIKQSLPELKVSSNVEERLNEIVNKYEQNLSQHFYETMNQDIVAKEDPKKEVSQEFSDILTQFTNEQNYLGLKSYLRVNPIDLPILKFRNEFINLLENNSVVIVKGEPGCGKSTQVPQYILENWAKNYNTKQSPCKIVISQPRRLAAISLAARVANERDENVGHVVGYQVRFKTAISHNTRIMYCTTGILLRYLQSDPLLTNFTHIVLDEAHERDVNTDILMNLLRTAIAKNPNLKLIIMSATIDTEVFRDYFHNAPTLSVPGFTYPVKVNFLDDIQHKIRLDRTLAMTQQPEPLVVHADVAKLIKYIHRTRDDGAILCFLPGWEDITKVRKMLQLPHDAFVLCLHSRLQDSDQRKIFSRAPAGVRKIILATNIAETSVTVDDVVYVIDTGIHKEERFDVDKGISSIDNRWISKANMKQRKGRAGRVRPGESFHLYTKSVYEDFEKYSMPEILRTSLTKIVLDSKVYSNNMNAEEFFDRFLCPPDKSAIQLAVEELHELKLLDESENLTPLGKTLSNFQLEPRLSVAMVNSVIFKCVTPIVDIVTVYSFGSELFSHGLMDKEDVRSIKQKFSDNSDHIALMNLFEKWLGYVENEDDEMALEFCSQHNLVGYKLNTLRKLRDVHFEYLYKGLRRVLPIADDCSDNEEFIKGVLISSTGNVLQPRSWDITKGRMKRTQVFITRKNQKATVTTDSVNYEKCKKSKDQLYLYINEVRSNLRRTTIIRETSLISPLCALLFNNNPLEIQEVDGKSELSNCDDDKVVAKLARTRIKYLCDRRQAIAIQKCKEALQNALQYYIFQMTKGNDHDALINSHWSEILLELNGILSDTSCSSKSSSSSNK